MIYVLDTPCVHLLGLPSTAVASDPDVNQGSQGKFGKQMVPSQRPLAPSVASVTSVANDNGDNEMILGAVHRSPGICLAEGNLS